MSKVLLATIGTSLGNVAAAIAARAEDSTPPVECFESCLGSEAQRLRSEGQEGLAEALWAFRAPLSRLLTEGW